MGEDQIANMQEVVDIAHNEIVSDVIGSSSETEMVMFTGLSYIVSRMPQLLGEALLNAVMASAIGAYKVGKAGMWVAKKSMNGVVKSIKFVAWVLPVAQSVHWIVKLPTMQRLLVAMAKLMVKYQCKQSGELQKVLDQKAIDKKAAENSYMGAMLHSNVSNKIKETLMVQEFTIGQHVETHAKTNGQQDSICTAAVGSQSDRAN